MVATPKYDLSTDTTLGGNSPSDIISPSEKAIKTYIDAHSGGASTLNELTDVTIASATTGQILQYDGTSSKWTNSTFSIPAAGSATQPIYIANDGTPTATTYSLAKSVPSDAKFTDTTYSNGTGITIGTGNAINHSNSVTAGTAGTSSATSGSTLSVPYVTYDAQGHVTASGTHTHTVTGFLTSSDVTSTYSATGTAPINGTGVASALGSYVPTSRTINGKALSSNITLSASDVSALPSSTTIGAANTIIKVDGSNVGTINANATSDGTISISTTSGISIASGSTNYLTYSNGAIGAKVDTTVTASSTNLVTSGAVDAAMTKVTFRDWGA